MKTGRKMVLIVLFLAGGMIESCNPSALAGTAPDLKQFAAGNNAFAYDLYAQLRASDGNLFFSPYSIATVLTMAYAGARGETAKEMAHALHLTLATEALHPAAAALAEHLQQLRKKGDVALDIANALWLQQDVKLRAEFQSLIKKYYGANLFPVNFEKAFEAVRVKINQWVEQQTSGKIKDLLAPGILSAATRLVLTNAIYFKGKWERPFEQELTGDEPFWLTAEQQIDVPMMRQQALFKYGELDTLQILELPYAGADLALIILLPKAKTGLAELERQLAPEHVQTWLAAAAMCEVEVHLPKFELTAQFNLTAALKALGMANAFAPDADFSGMVAEAQLSISDVIHKAFVEVNEEGTEAAAATAGVVGVTSVQEPQPIPVFQADHPFVCLLRDAHSGSILFLGRIVNPAE